jgi:hypothetical protein
VGLKCCCSTADSDLSFGNEAYPRRRHFLRRVITRTGDGF